ncbi:MAG TPA: polysaccharide pyruvyl transferase family protein [Candidatus Atribacteria bacterium]|nr:polysaccharide pyruvyl transferase family protein [Candidatus Atribacteria bacterium]
MKKKKLVLAGFDKVKNFGDPILYRCAEYLIRDLVKGSDVEIVHLNLFGSGSTGKIKGLQLKAVNSLIWRIKKRKKADRLVSLLENHAVKTSVSRYYKRALKDASCLIFAGGGLIKYKYETFDYRLRLLIRQAEKQGIPVALNAVGVEDYSEANTRCQLMKKALNSPVVKMITTRDDIELLNNKYITNNDIVTARVADPAFWCDVVYNIKKKADSDVIGLGVVRSGIFKDKSTCI